MNNQSSNRIMNMIWNLSHNVRRAWTFILFFTLLCGLGYDSYKTITYVPMYRTQATFAIQTGDTIGNEDDGLGDTFTYIFQSNVFKKSIQNYLGVNSLNGYYEASSYANTNILYVSALSPSIETSYKMMEGLMENYHSITSLVVGNTNIEVVKNISVPITPTNSINHKRNILLFSAIGFVVSFSLLASLAYLENTIQDSSDIEAKLHLKLYGSLPKESKMVNYLRFQKKKAILINQYSTSFSYVEAIKKVRVRVERYLKKHNGKVIMVTSSLENEGKSSVAVNLALSLAQAHHKVLLIDGDFRKPSCHLILNQKKKRIGIEHVLTKEKSLEEAIVKIDNQLDALFGFLQVKGIEDYIQSNEMKELIDQVKEQYDYVVIDSAPSRFLSDSQRLTEYVDGILLVVKQNHAKIPTIQTTIEKLSLSNTPIMGCINNQTFMNLFASEKYYGYGYGNYYKTNRKG